MESDSIDVYEQIVGADCGSGFIREPGLGHSRLKPLLQPLLQPPLLPGAAVLDSVYA